VHEQLDKSSRNSGFNNGLDFIIGTIGKIRDSPACINQDLVIKGVNKFRKNRESRRDLEGVSC
jgi:hypothetical protein